MILFRRFIFAALVLGVFCIISVKYEALINVDVDDTMVSHHYNLCNNECVGCSKYNGPLCGRADIRQGRWVERVNATGAIGGGSELAEPDRYRWVPKSANNDNISHFSGNNSTSCQYNEDFNPTLFCDLMENAVIMFIGDSIIWEMYQSLVHLLGARAYKRVHIRATFKRGLPVWINVCGDKNVTLLYRWNKQLDGVGTSVSIDQMLQEHFPTMIILNTGAHYQINSALRPKLDHVLDLVIGWQQQCQERNITSCPFFWRTSQPGIFNCKNFTGPADSLEKMEQYVADHPLYNWEKFHIQNQIVLGMLEEASELKGLSYGVIDGYEIGLQRPEFHNSASDCLHSFHLAAADAENTVLLHYIASSRTKEDILSVAKYNYSFPRITNVNTDGRDINWTLVNGS